MCVIVGTVPTMKPIYKWRWKKGGSTIECIVYTNGNHTVTTQLISSDGILDREKNIIFK